MNWKKISLFLISFILLCFSFCLPIQAQEKNVEARIVEILQEGEVEVQGEQQFYQELRLELINQDQTVTVEVNQGRQVGSLRYEIGDRVLLAQAPGSEQEYYITEVVRQTPLIVLAVIFSVLVLAIGQLRGLTSLLSMALSFLVITQLILPEILKGTNPLLVSLAGALIIIPPTFYLAHGLNKKTTVAIGATVVSLLVTSLLAFLFVNQTMLTGYASEEAGYLQTVKASEFNMQGLLLAGIIIGVLGILDDITVAQAAVVFQLNDVNPQLTFKQLFTKSLSIGQDHIASMVNTLILAYTGASLPLVLLFIDSPRPFGQIINFEVIAEEVVRTLVASIGLVLAVPVTTVAAAWLAKRG
jgi:uncharacterized membrane protein